jgi:hypothetical protein
MRISRLKDKMVNIFRYPEYYPAWDPHNKLLFLPNTEEKWDIELSDKTTLLVRSGIYRCNFASPIRVRTFGKVEWGSFFSGINAANYNNTDITLELPEPLDQIAYVDTVIPSKHFIVGEELILQFLPAEHGYYEVQFDNKTFSPKSLLENNCLRFKEELPAGNYKITVRWVPKLEEAKVRRWTDWSSALSLTYHSLKEQQKVRKIRIDEHRLSLMSDKDMNGVVTITDPRGFPPSCPENEPIKWFRTPCYDGAGILLNEQEDYYRDPLSYYTECIQRLKEKGVVFKTWHDMLDGNYGGAKYEVLVQYDMDGGPRSMERIFSTLERMDVRANIMIHRECHDWYAYTIEDLNLEYLQKAEKAGWTIGYHNNSIGNVQRTERAGDYGEDVLNAARERFREDVLHLRKWFTIRTFTHHGGNVLNKLTPVPEDLDIVCADRLNQPLWRTIQSSFSDGGFMVRPCTLRDKVNNLKSGLHFFRNHPVKYANYLPPFDIPPLDIRDAEKTGYAVNQELSDWIRGETEKQNLWLTLRSKYRMARRLTYASTDKPISEGFRPFAEIEPLVRKFHARRTEHFLREYPWIMGDPRVFWWRMLDSFAPKEGKLLNVGALPPDKRDETTSFVGPEVQVVEMDIDPKREPHILGDITNPPRELYGQFEGVLLMGLPYIHSPGKAVEACARLTRSGGIGLFGFSADTHPLRGGLWKPYTRPVWRRDIEPLQDIGLKGYLWSFDEKGLQDLFINWRNVRIEFFSHYWFAVCQRDAA